MLICWLLALSIYNNSCIYCTSINPNFMVFVEPPYIPQTIHPGILPPGIPTRQPPLISTRMAQSSPAVSPQDLAAGYAALAAAYAQAAAEEEAEGEVPNPIWWKVMVIWDDGLFFRAKIWHKNKTWQKVHLHARIGGLLFSISVTDWSKFQRDPCD